MQEKIRIMLVGGGTGGHFYPLISIAEVLKQSELSPRLYYIGPDPYDSEALSRVGITFVYCPSGKQRRYRSMQNILDLFKIASGLFVALIKLFSIYPDVIMTKGGHTSVPVIIAARLLRIPIVVHESDAVPGRANLLGARYARYVAVSYPEAMEKFPEEKTILTGIPIRSELLVSPQQSVSLPFSIPGDAHVILVLGGSQGAERINDLILESLDELLKRFVVIHQTGKTNFDIVSVTSRELIRDPLLQSRYFPIAFLSAPMLNTALHRSSIVISRAGSGAIHEIATHGKPSILIPIPEEVSHDQRTNAYAYARTGASIVMEENNLHDGLLMAEISRIMQDPVLYTSMTERAQSFAPRNASNELSRMILNIAQQHL